MVQNFYHINMTKYIYLKTSLYDNLKLTLLICFLQLLYNLLISNDIDSENQITN